MRKARNLLVCLCFYYSGFSQCLDQKDIQYLHSTIGIFLQDHEFDKEPIKRKSEFIICLLDIGSNGQVTNIHLLCDSKARDLAYTNLSKMSPDLFKDWKSMKCKGKTIIIPIASIERDSTPEYMERIIKFYSSNSLSAKESENVVITSLLKYNTPIINKEEPPDEVKKINN